jgi:hypothetical protein
MSSAAAHAQDCNSIFQSGLEMSKKRATIPDAIRRLETAKRCYNLIQDTEGAKRCDEIIAECNVALMAPHAPTPVPAYRAISLSISKDEVSLPAEGGKDSVRVDGNIDWSVSSYPDWYTVDKGSDQLVIKANKNTKTAPRTQSLTIRYGMNRELHIKVTQAGSEEALSLSENTIRFPPDMTWDKVVTVTTNGDWDFSDVPEWCGAVKLNNMLVLSPSVNDEQTDRKGTIHVTAGSKKEDLLVIQRNDYITIEPPQYTFPKAGGKKEFQIVYSSDAVLSFGFSNTHTDWCKITKADGNRIVVQCLPNKKNVSRSDAIVITKRNQRVTIPVSQDGKKR